MGGGESLAAQIKNYGLSHCVEMIGELSHAETLKIMAASHFLLMPSRHEGQGIVCVEAMANGCVPVVSHLAGVTDEMIDDGENGRLIEVGDTNSFSEQLLLCFSPEYDYSRISRNAYFSAIKV